MNYIDKLQIVIYQILDRNASNKRIFIIQDNDIDILKNQIEEFNDKLFILIETQSTFAAIAIGIWINLGKLKYKNQDLGRYFLKALENFQERNKNFKDLIQSSLIISIN